MVGGREFGQRKERVVRRLPEDTAIEIGQTGLGRQYIVDPQVARRVIGSAGTGETEVGGVEGGIADMIIVGAALQLGGHRAAVAGGGYRRVGGGAVDEGAVEQLICGTVHAVAVEGIGVVITQDHKALALGKAAVCAVVVVDVVFAGDVIGPETDFVVIARAVTILGAVVNRRRRMRGQHVNSFATDDHRHVHMVLRGKPQDLEFFLGVPARGISVAIGIERVLGQQSAGHVLPEKVLEGADVRGVDLVFREDHETELAFEEAEALGVIRREVTRGA